MAPDDERQGSDEPVRLRDARAIRALAHPARLAVLDALTGRATITATEAAEVAGLSPSAMSYHLRALAKWGIVREAASADDADGRERRWERAGKGMNLDPPAQDAGGATAFIAMHYFDQVREQLVRWLDGQHTAPEFWRENSIVAFRQTWLTEEQALALRRSADAVLDDNTGTRGDPPDDARQVRVSFLMFPIDSTESSPGGQ